MRFEPAGMTDDPDIRIATSLMDYLFRRLAVEYLSFEERAELSIYTTGERTQQTLPGVEETVVETRRRAGTSLPTRPRSSRRPPWRCSCRWRRRRARPPDAPHVHAVRRPDAAGRLLPRLPQLRHHQRLQLTQGAAGA